MKGKRARGGEIGRKLESTSFGIQPRHACSVIVISVLQSRYVCSVIGISALHFVQLYLLVQNRPHCSPHPPLVPSLTFSVPSHPPLGHGQGCSLFLCSRLARTAPRDPYVETAAARESGEDTRERKGERGGGRLLLEGWQSRQRGKGGTSDLKILSFFPPA